MFTPAYKRYVIGTLTLVYTLNSLDSGLMILLLQPIKQELRLSDSQLGILTGIAFAVFYATLGLPFARWADRGNRATITSLAVGLWGLTVMSCLFVTNFIQLIAARIAAGVGESGCMPPTYSLLGDYFPEPAERTRAMTVYWLANPLAALISFIAGGWLNERYGWRVTFFLMGVPALIFALLVKLTVAEPRTHTSIIPSRRRETPRLTQVLAVLWQQRSSRHLSIALILLYTMGAGLGAWYGAFLMRSHGMGTAELGLWLGLIFGLSGIAGIALGGYIAVRWFADNPAGQMRLSAAMTAAVVPCFVLFLLLQNKLQTLIALVPLIMVFTFYLGPTFALLQRLVPNEMRATTLAIVMLLANLIGMGIGPEVVGMLSDCLKASLGADSLRYAMLVMSLVGVWAAYHFWQVGRTVDQDLLGVIQRAASENTLPRQIDGIDNACQQY
jgi:MFS family permease